MTGTHAKLTTGLYDEPITARLRRAVDEALSTHANDVDDSELDGAEAAEILSRLVQVLTHRVLASVPEKERPTRQVEIVNELVQHLHARFPDLGIDHDVVDVPARMLESVVLPGVAHYERPLIAPSEAALLVNGRGEPRVGEEIRREIGSADRIDLLCSFIKWYGLRVVEEPLLRHLQAGKPLRVLTTTYMAATESRPIAWLIEHGAQVRISYDTDSTRLHAKAWLFQRDSGVSTALVGSSNLSRTALLDGAEWNVRLSQKTTPHVLKKFASTFDAYWNAPSFEPYDEERLRIALRSERSTSSIDFALLDVHPYPHQREILEALTIERERHQRWKNLVVAATGTGKTVVAALDYRRLREQLAPARLLFVAHRKEILEQTLRTFRTVLRDGSFGELFVDGDRPSEWKHVFASVQSLSASADQIDPSAFDVVVIDEFHHANAPTYRKLIERLRPKLLLGLTATPERTDGSSILHWFDDRIAAELRLWDALDRRLLAPFQYFGVHDDVDLSQLPWKRGGYDQAALDKVYTGNDARVLKVLEQLRRRVPDVAKMRALGFCVSVEHAQYMARSFTKAGIKAVALWGGADRHGVHGPERASVLKQLREREINVVFAVDIFNEGLDVPEIDTVIFLRPTESATLFLQQLGRGLRRADDKPCLTVLDFIGAQHRNFRFDQRYAALLSVPRTAVLQQVQSNFPFLPAGCHLELDRVASAVIIKNLKNAIGRRDQLVQTLRDLGAELGEVTLPMFLERTGLSLEEFYKNDRSFVMLRRLAGLPAPKAGPREEALLLAVGRMLHVDDVERVGRYREWLKAAAPPAATTMSARDRRLLLMLHVALRDREPWPTLAAALEDLWQHPAVIAELIELLGLLDARAPTLSHHVDGELPLRLHARYSRNEIRAAFDQVTAAKPGSHREGVDWVKSHKTDVFFVTLQKSARDFSPSTMYADHALAPQLFHWQSQSGTNEATPTGQRYINHIRDKSTINLFARETNTDKFVCLGPATYLRHQGGDPMSIEWHMTHAMPEWFLRQALIVRV
ncbi:MAG: DUF3427 domain-containing protein [Deltaproteobacteria bacterium]|nr:DUF3427 domain-containing protein [Deltaproteobacteria bacterium]